MYILEARNISFEASGKRILENISAKVEKGDCISIVGPSGSGKSTFLKLCSYLINPAAGELYYKEQPFSTYEPTELRRVISYSTQGAYLFGNTVRENLEFPYIVNNTLIDIPWILKTMDAFGLNESIINKNVASLSGGEKQRISLIRNLAHKPAILLLDEVTSALDSDSSIMVENHIKKLAESGTTVLWITHDQEQSSRIFDKRMNFLNGQLTNIEVI